jgi:hypothetical protein
MIGPQGSITIYDARLPVRNWHHIDTELLIQFGFDCLEGYTLETLEMLLSWAVTGTGSI